MWNSRSFVGRRILVALAAVAAMILLLRPVCDLWFVHFGAGAASVHPAAMANDAPFEHDDDTAVQCCTSIGKAHHIAPLQVVAGGVQAPQDIAAAVFVAVLLMVTAFVARQPHRLRAPPRSPRSFYLRSARILR